MADVGERMPSVSAVFVVENAVPSREDIHSLAGVLADHFVDYNFIFVANGSSDAAALVLKNIIAETPDTMCLFLGEHTDADFARIVGIDHAIGDHVLLATPTKAEISALPSMIEATRQGFDLVIAKNKAFRTRHRWLYHRTRRLFLRFLRFLTGVTIDPNSSRLRLFSRPAALHVLGQRHAELLLQSSEIAPGFPCKILRDAFDEPVSPTQRSMSRSVTKGLRAIISTGTIPMRLASVAALTAGGLALLYSLYIVATYFFKPDVAPGWTTVSLQVTGMMFLFALVFVLLAEYIIQIYEGMPVSRRRYVVRELNSEQTRRSGRLNIVDGDGEFQLGAPQDLAPDVRVVGKF